MQHAWSKFAFGVLCLFGLQAGAHAVVINGTSSTPADAIALGAVHGSVVELFLGPALCSGALISTTHIVTAEHCTSGVGVGAMTVNFDADGDGAPEHAIGVLSKTEMNPTNILTDGTDIAILELVASAPAGFEPLRFATGVTFGVLADMVGFGLNGVGSVGHQNTRDGRRWAAQNVLDGATADLRLVATDFDDGTLPNNSQGSAVPVTHEGTTAPGDSGGPLLIDNLIVGVLSGGTSPFSTFGDQSLWTSTFRDSTRAFILANSDARFRELALPGVLLLMLPGMLTLHRSRRRRRVVVAPG